jgi:hypothetical protein
MQTQLKIAEIQRLTKGVHLKDIILPAILALNNYAIAF